MANTLRRSTFQLIKKQKLVASAVTSRFKSTNSEEKNIVKSIFKDVPVTNDLICDFIWQNLDRWPDKTATVCAVTGRGYTYAQTHKMSNIFAASLRSKLKLKDGDKVAIILPNLPEYPCAMYGVLQAGCVAVMMNPAYTPYEFQKQLETVPCDAIITAQVSYPNIKTALNALKLKIPVVVLENENIPEGTIKFSELAGDLNMDIDVLKSVRRNADDTAVIPFSSGTTGFPKGVILDHRSVVASNRMIADPDIVAVQETTETYQAVLPAVIPFFHIFGLNALMLNQMHLGCKLVTLPYFKPELFLQSIAQHRAHVLFIVPPMVVFLGKHPAVKAEHLQSIEGIISGAASLSEADVAAVIAKNKNIAVRQGYGLTETNGGAMVGRNGDSNYASVGHVLGSCQVKIADLDTQDALGPGQEGEIWIRGPLLMRGYYNNDAATAEVMHGDWFKTGDIGKYDDRQYVYVTDRLKELIKVKGFQVPPAELEMVLRTHPKILDCAVLGIPDPITGEVPKAFLVPQPGQKVDPKEVLEYVNSKVVKYKQIQEVQFVEEIPKNPAGKVLRKVLKEKYL